MSTLKIMPLDLVKPLVIEMIPGLREYQAGRNIEVAHHKTGTFFVHGAWSRVRISVTLDPNEDEPTAPAPQLDPTPSRLAGMQGYIPREDIP